MCSLAEVLVEIPVLNERIDLGGLGYVCVVISDAHKVSSFGTSIQTVSGGEEMALGYYHSSTPMTGDTTTSAGSDGSLPRMTTPLCHISPNHALLSVGVLIGQVILEDSASTRSMYCLARPFPQPNL